MSSCAFHNQYVHCLHFFCYVDVSIMLISLSHLKRYIALSMYECVCFPYISQVNLPEYLLFCDLLLLGSEVLFRMSQLSESIQSSLTSAKLSFLKCNLW